MRCRKGGPLAVTDANLLLGRLIPDYFPKIFGKSEKEPLDVDATRDVFEKLAQNINKNSANDFSLDEIIYGCVRPDSQNSMSQYNVHMQVHQGRQRDHVSPYTRADRGKGIRNFFTYVRP